MKKQWCAVHTLRDYAPAFERIHPSANLFLDFFYFNIVTMSTVGYGDIIPNTVAAKLVCSAEILFTLFILVAVAGILIQSVMDAKNNEAIAPQGESR